jgi:hypothetical protein
VTAVPRRSCWGEQPQQEPCFCNRAPGLGQLCGRWPVTLFQCSSLGVPPEIGWRVHEHQTAFCAVGWHSSSPSRGSPFRKEGKEPNPKPSFTKGTLGRGFGKESTRRRPQELNSDLRAIGSLCPQDRSTSIQKFRRSVKRTRIQILFNAKELIVFSHSIGPRSGTCLDLSGAQRHH